MKDKLKIDITNMISENQDILILIKYLELYAIYSMKIHIV